MLPVIIAAGVVAAGAAAQLYTSEKARGAERKRLDEIERLFNSVKPPDYDLSVNDPPELHKEMQALPQFSKPMNAPEFNLNKLSQEDLKLVGKYIPQLAPSIVEAAPQLLTKTQDMKSGREAQMTALRKMQEIGASDFDPEYQEKVQQAARSAQGEAQSRQASIMQDFARRGIAGSGLNLASQMGAASQSMDRAAQMNQAAASDAYKNRLNALMSGAQLGGQISQEDMQFQGRNADVINSFNERVSRNRQAMENQNAQMMNAAQQYNLGNEQKISDQNILGRNRLNEMDQARKDDITRYSAGFNQGERDRVDRNAMWNYGQKDAQTKYLNDIISSEAKWKAGEKDRINNLKSRIFQDEADINRGKAGIASTRNDADIGAARDRNAVYQGVTNAAMAVAMGMQGQQDSRSNQYNQANLEHYKRTGGWMDQGAKDSYYKSYGD